MLGTRKRMAMELPKLKEIDLEHILEVYNKPIKKSKPMVSLSLPYFKGIQIPAHLNWLTITSKVSEQMLVQEIQGLELEIIRLKELKVVNRELRKICKMPSLKGDRGGKLGEKGLGGGRDGTGGKLCPCCKKWERKNHNCPHTHCLKPCKKLDEFVAKLKKRAEKRLNSLGFSDCFLSSSSIESQLSTIMSEIKQILTAPSELRRAVNPENPNTTYITDNPLEQMLECPDKYCICCGSYTKRHRCPHSLCQKPCRREQSQNRRIEKYEAEKYGFTFSKGALMQQAHTLGNILQRFCSGQMSALPLMRYKEEKMYRRRGRNIRQLGSRGEARGFGVLGSGPHGGIPGIPGIHGESDHTINMNLPLFLSVDQGGARDADNTELFSRGSLGENVHDEGTSRDDEHDHNSIAHGHGELGELGELEGEGSGSLYTESSYMEEEESEHKHREYEEESKCLENGEYVEADSQEEVSSFTNPEQVLKLWEDTPHLHPENNLSPHHLTKSIQ